MSGFVALLNAEWIKLRSTRGPVWALLGAAVVSVGLAALLGSTSYPRDPMDPGKAAMGVVLLGIPVLMVLSSAMVTGEYRTAMIRTSFLACPNRALMLLSKAVVAAVFSAVSAAILTAMSLAAAGAVAPRRAAAGVSLTLASSWEQLGAVALYAGLAAILGVGVGALVRSAPAAVAVLLLWPLVLESVLGVLPDIGSKVGPYLPFANANAFAGVTALMPTNALNGGLGAIAYFGAVCVAVYAAGVAMVVRRDA